MTTVEFRAAGVTDGPTTILRPTTLTLTERRTAVIGANGSGKSTLVRLVNGLVAPSSGQVLVDGLDVHRHGREVRRRVGFLFADADAQIIMPTVREDVAFSLRRSSLSRAETRRRVDATLERFDLADKADRSPHTLSGGEKQMLALAAVTVMEPAVLLADEPTTALDLIHRNRIRDVLATLPQQVIVVTHDLGLVEGYDRALCVDSGAVVDDGPPTDVVAGYVRRMEGTA